MEIILKILTLANMQTHGNVSVVAVWAVDTSKANKFMRVTLPT